MFFFIVGNEIFYFFKKMSLCLLGRGNLTDLEFSFLGWEEGGGGRGKTRWGRYFWIGLILWRTLWWIFGKWFMKMSKGKTFISRQTYLYIQVTNFLKFYEVLFCKYCKGLLSLKNNRYACIPLYVHKTLPTLGNEKEQ